MNNAVCLFAIIALACAAPRSDVTTGDAATGAAAIDTARLANHVRVLASDDFLGRGPATPGETKTVAYIVDQLRAAGVQPGGPNGSWYQEVPLMQSDIVGQPTLAFTVGGQPQPLTQGEQIAVRATMQNIDRVAIDGAPVVFLGRPG